MQKTQFDKRLFNYSLAASAILFSAETINAQVWGFDVSPDEVLDTHNETLAITLDGNFRFNIRYAESGGYHLVTIAEQTASASWIERGAGRAKALNSGYVVNSTKSFATDPNRFADKGTSGAFISGSSWFNADKYIGVRFKIGGDTHYGWILVNVSVLGNDLQSITVKSYAFEQAAGSPITADGTLPVELSAFNANLNASSVELNWETATEVNNFGFNVECSIDNVQWETKGFVAGNGTTSSPKQYFFIDSNLPEADKVSYRLKQIDNDGTFSYSKIVNVDLTTITGVEDQNKPLQFALGQNYPNPFNPSTTINFSLPEAGTVKLSVYNSLGQEVRTLLEEQKSAGEHRVDFDGSNLPSGFYTYQIDVDGKYTSTKKMLIIK